MTVWGWLVIGAFSVVGTALAGRGRADKPKAAINPEALQEPDIAISYTDNMGSASSRHVAIREITTAVEGLLVIPVYLNCWCFASSGERTFRVDRISKLTDLKSGSVADSPQEWITDFVCKHPNLRKNDRDAANLTALMYGSKTFLLNEPLQITFKYSDSVSEVRTVAATSIAISGGLIVSVGGKESHSGTQRNYRLSRMRELIDADGSVVNPDYVQTWLRKRVFAKSRKLNCTEQPSSPVRDVVLDSTEILSGGVAAGKQRFTIMEITISENGLLRDITGIIAWSHVSTDYVELAMDKIRSAELAETGEALPHLHEWLRTIANQNDGLARTVPGGRIRLDDAQTSLVDVSPFVVELKNRDGTEWYVVSVKKLQVTGGRLITAIRGENRDTGRLRTFPLKDLTAIREPGKRGRVKDDIQVWLQERSGVCLSGRICALSPDTASGQ